MSSNKKKNQKKGSNGTSSENVKDTGVASQGSNKPQPSSSQAINSKPVLTKASSFINNSKIEFVKSEFYEIDTYAKDLIVGKKKSVNGLVM